MNPLETTRAKKRFFFRGLQKFSLDIVILVVLFLFCLWILFEMADMIFLNKNTAFDRQVFALVAPYINPATTSVMQFITFFGSHLFLLPANILLAVVFLFIKNHRAYSWKFAAISLTSTAVLFFLKDVLKRQRPLVPLIAKAHGYSFPSGHTFSSVVFYGLIAYLVYKTVKSKLLKWILVVCCFLFAFLIGFSRVYLMVHYPSDVIAGMCLGVIWLLLAKWFLLK